MRERLMTAALMAGRAVRPLRIRGIPRILYTTAPLLVGGGVQTLETVDGFKLRLDVRDYFGCMMLYGRFAPDVVATLSAIVRRGDSVIDVGAQIGYVTSHLARLVGPTGAVHSFEPDPSSLERLRAAVTANGNGWVRIFPVAASSSAGEITLYASPTLGWSTAVAGTHLEGVVPTTVACMPIDDLDAAGQIRGPVRAVKIDVEGFEPTVLDGMQRLLARDRPFVLTEVSPEMLRPAGHTSVDLLSRIVKHGYRTFRLGERRDCLVGRALTLTRIDPTEPQEFCDVLCVPDGEAVPPAIEEAMR